MLDLFSRALHHPGTRYLFLRTSAASTLHLPDGALTNVLLTASRHADAPLATQAFQALVARRARVAVHHYEALVDMHAATGAVADALRVLFIMARAGVVADRASTRALYRAMAKPAGLQLGSARDDGGVRLDVAFDALPGLVAEYGILPAAAGDVVIEAAAQRYGFDIAMETYRTIQSLAASLSTSSSSSSSSSSPPSSPPTKSSSPTPSTSTPASVWTPTIHTFLPLVSHCTDARALSALAADFLAAGGVRLGLSVLYSPFD